MMKLEVCEMINHSLIQLTNWVFAQRSRQKSQHLNTKN